MKKVLFTSASDFAPVNNRNCKNFLHLYVT